MAEKAPGKLVKRVGDIRIYRDLEWDQWVVVDSLDSDRGWYYADDKPDAESTAREMAKQAKKRKPGLPHMAAVALAAGELPQGFNPAGGKKVRAQVENAYHRALAKPGKHRSRGGYRVCARTTSGGWATWTRDKGSDLSGPAAEKLMRKLRREGFEVAKFKGRKKVSK